MDSLFRVNIKKPRQAEKDSSSYCCHMSWPQNEECIGPLETEWVKSFTPSSSRLEDRASMLKSRCLQNEPARSLQSKFSGHDVGLTFPLVVGAQDDGNVLDDDNKREGPQNQAQGSNDVFFSSWKAETCLQIREALA